jgi:hypothetical protein
MAQAEHENQLLAEDRESYEEFVKLVEENQHRVAPAYRIAVISFQEWRAYADLAISDSAVRGAQATNRALTALVRRDQRDAVVTGKPDPAWQTPASAAGLKMSIEQAKKYARQQAEHFVGENPEYHRTQKNFETIASYLADQGVEIPTAETLKLAWERLRSFGMIEERMAPVPTPEPVSENPPESIPSKPELVDGFDPDTGEPRKYSQREIWKMDSMTFRKAFRMWGDNQPKFTRGYFD